MSLCRVSSDENQNPEPRIQNPEPRTGSAAWQRDGKWPHSLTITVTTDGSPQLNQKQFSEQWINLSREGSKREIQKLFGLALKCLPMLIGLCVCVLFSSDWSCSETFTCADWTFVSVLHCLALSELFTCADCILTECVLTNALAGSHHHHQDSINWWHEQDGWNRAFWAGPPSYAVN